MEGRHQVAELSAIAIAESGMAKHTVALSNKSSGIAGPGRGRVGKISHSLRSERQTGRKLSW